MSKRRIYYQHLHFKGSKQGLSWETQFHDTPTILKSGPDALRHARGAAHRHNMAATRTHGCTRLAIACLFPPAVLHSPCRLNLTSLPIHLFSLNKRKPSFLPKPFLASPPLQSNSLSLGLFFCLVSLHSRSDRRFLLLKPPSIFPLKRSARREFVIIYDGLFVINSSTFCLPSPVLRCGSATGCLVRLIYPRTVPVELNLCSPWH